MELERVAWHRKKKRKELAKAGKGEAVQGAETEGGGEGQAMRLGQIHGKG